MASLPCSPEALASLSLPSLDIQFLHANPVVDYPILDAVQVPNHGLYPAGTVSFCNVTITYNHPNEDDYPIIFEAWLPDHEKWNERILAVGGSGFAAGRFPGVEAPLAGAVSENYATFTTDGGNSDSTTPAFAVKEKGVLDVTAVANWGSVALGDMADIGKALVEHYYGKEASYSYFSGCSQGGRQGYELAQRYPEAFDGIAGSAPVIQGIETLHYIYWPQHLMNQAQTWPRGCELDSLNKMAVEACDEKDGVKDGILADPRSCDPFIPLDHVGEAAISCANPSSLISEMAAFVVNATWHGLVDEEGQLLYPGLHPGTDLSGNTTFGIAATTCQDDEDEGCEGEPSALGLWGVQAFGFQNMEADLTQITPDEFYGGLGEAIELVGEYFQSDDPDLSEFRSRGGKFITYHGLSDQLVASNALRGYYDKVSERYDDVADFYRFFEIPALGHCQGIQHPDSTFNDLKRWVEEGVAPEKLKYQQPDEVGNEGERIACPYPQKATYKSCCGDPDSAKCYTCK